MNRIEKIFNELIQIKLPPHHYADNLLYVELRYVAPYRYDLIFGFKREYNNPAIKLASIINTCDDLFSWVSIRDVVNIVVITEGNSKHYSYFELFDAVNNHYSHHPYEIRNNRNYPEYLQWREEKKYREKMESYWRMSMENLERSDYEQQKRVTQKKKFLFW
jgi:hypothetical protein